MNISHLSKKGGGAGRGRRQNCIFWVSLATCKIIHLHKFEDKVFPSLTIRPLARVGEIYDLGIQFLNCLCPRLGNLEMLTKIRKCTPLNFVVYS